MQKLFSTSFFLAFFVFIAGCGDGGLKTYPVSGTVTLNGEAVTGATVSFTPKVAGEGDGAFARTDNRGFYQLQTTQGRVDGGTTPGEYYVTISKVEMVGTGTFTTDSEGNRIEGTRPVSVIPEIYGTAEGGLSAMVEKKRNEFNFELEQ